MKLSTLLALPASLLTAVYATASLPSRSGAYTEHLHLQPLPSGTLYAGFTFNSSTPLRDYENQYFRFFPRSLAQILQYTRTAELHLRFALGRWDEESWGSRPRDGLREGGNGVELWAWVENGEAEGERAEQRWSDLVNSLSGLFCASLNFVDAGKTIRPVLGFESEGMLDALQDALGGESRELELLHGMLPHEVVCTENLTPFLKLLPCKGKAGISSLLDGHKVFDANWQTMSIDVRPVCTEDKGCELEVQQTVDMVLDVERSLRPSDKRIPRPVPIEEIECDESKPYNAHDTCYPKVKEGEREWSLSGLFGRPVKGSCPLSDAEHHEITLETLPDRKVDVVSEAKISPSASADGRWVSYRVPEGTDFDLSLPQQVVETAATISQPPLYASRQITGYGQERGGMHIRLRNPQPYIQRVVYLESLPWFLRPYMHTLQVDGGKVEKMFYKPLLDRQRGTHLELLLEIPAESEVELQYDFEKAILRYTEYPPDANRGFDIPPAIVRVLPAKEGEQGSYLRTTSLLLPLPTPDFSMPYNVIILTSTVIALGFGSIFNLLVRRFVLVEEVPVSPLAVGIGKVRERVKGIVAKVKGGKQAGDVNGFVVNSGGSEAKANGAVKWGREKTS